MKKNQKNSVFVVLNRVILATLSTNLTQLIKIKEGNVSNKAKNAKKMLILFFLQIVLSNTQKNAKTLHSVNIFRCSKLDV